MEKWKLVSSKMAFDHKWFKVRQDTVELPTGKVLDDFFVWLQGHVALVVPVTRDNKFILVRQYKHGLGEITVEFPAGMIDSNEDPLTASKRELAEETGYTSTDVTLLSIQASNPTKVIGDVHIYLAMNVEKTQEQNFDPNEEIEVLVKTYDEVLELIDTGEMCTNGTISAFFLASRKLGLLV